MYVNKENKKKNSQKIAIIALLIILIMTALLFFRNYNTHTITFKDYDDSILQISKVKHGEMPVFKGIVTRPSDKKYDYIFISWDKPLTKAIKDETYTAVYSSNLIANNKNSSRKPNSASSNLSYKITKDSNQLTEKEMLENQTFTITFKDDDGTILKSSIYKYGSTPSCYVSSKIVDGYKYTFKDWSPSIQVVTADQTYTATYTKTKEDSKVETYEIKVSVYLRDLLKGSVSGGGTYEKGTNVTIIAIPKTGYKFLKWNDENTSPTRTITVTKDESYTAYFAQIQHTITLSVNNSNMGSVTGSGTYDYGKTVTIAALPKEHCHFVSWSDGDTNVSKKVEVKQNQTFTATFAYDQYTLTANSNNSNMGSVTGSGTYDYGKTVTIAALSKEHCHFVSWNDKNTNASRGITVAQNQTFTATFAYDQYTLTANSNNSNMGSVTGSGKYEYNTKVTIEAKPNTGYRFVKWNDENTNPTRTITVAKNENYTAIFSPNQCTLTVNSNDSNMGSTSGSGTYDYGTSVTISATPKEHHHFVSWSDGNKDLERLVNITKNETYTATFSIDQYTLTVNTNNSNMGSITGSGTYDYGTKHTIEAIPNTGYKFVKWSDNNTEIKREININGNKSITATFEPLKFSVTIFCGCNADEPTFGSGTYEYGQIAIVGAERRDGWLWCWSDNRSWDDNCWYTSLRRTIVVTENIELTVEGCPTLQYPGNATDEQ